MLIIIVKKTIYNNIFSIDKKNKFQFRFSWNLNNKTHKSLIKFIQNTMMMSVTVAQNTPWALKIRIAGEMRHLVYINKSETSAMVAPSMNRLFYPYFFNPTIYIQVRKDRRKNDMGMNKHNLNVIFVAFYDVRFYWRAICFYTRAPLHTKRYNQ